MYALCTLRKSNIVSGWGLWFTFIYRKQGHLAVEDFVSKDLLALVGTHISWSPHPPLLCFHYTTLCSICQALFWKLSKFIFFRETLDLNLVVFRGSFPSPVEVIQRGQTPYSRQAVFWSPHPSHPYCITTWVICQGVFRNFLKFLFKQHHSLGRCDPLVVSLVTGGDSLSFPLTPIVYHRPHTKSTGNVAQIRDFSWQLFCSFCLLTNWLGCGIMEIRGQDNRSRAAENPNGKSALVVRRFDFQYFSLNECEVCPKPTTAPTDVIVFFISVVARWVQIN